MGNSKEDVELREGNISIILDSYDDIFSDFDPRHYAEKSLSQDFLDECKRATLDKEKEEELRLIMPKQKRNFQHEKEIKQRLKKHFQKHYYEEIKKIRGIKKTGIVWFFVGAIMMFIATFILTLEKKEFWINFFVILLEPAAWFMFWEGMRKFFIDAKEKSSNYNFYKKMIGINVIFFSY